VTGYDINRSTGNLLCRIHGMDSRGDFSMQHLVDQVGRGPWISKITLADQIGKNRLSLQQNRQSHQGHIAKDRFAYIDM